MRVALIAVSMVAVLRTLMHLHAPWWVYGVVVAAGICWYVVGMGDGRLAEREEQLKRQVEPRAEAATTRMDEAAPRDGEGRSSGRA